MKVLVAGYGNPFREDDRIGYELAPKILDYLRGKEGVSAELWLEQQLLPEIVDDMAGKDLVLFVDAAAEGPDEFRIEKIQPDPNIEGLNIHSMGPAWILSLMESLDMPFPETLLISVRGHSFDFKDETTPICKSRMDKAFAAFAALWEREYA